MSGRRANCCRHPKGGGCRFVRGQAKWPRSGSRDGPAEAELNGCERRTRRWYSGTCIARIAWLTTKNGLRNGRKRLVVRPVNSTRSIQSQISLAKERGLRVKPRSAGPKRCPTARKSCALKLND